MTEPGHIYGALPTGLERTGTYPRRLPAPSANHTPELDARENAATDLPTSTRSVAAPPAPEPEP